MLEFLEANALELILTVIYILIVAPFLRSRNISDANLLTTFDGVENLVKKVDLKEIDFRESITRVNKTVDKVEEYVSTEIKEIKNAVLEFQNDEIYLKMMEGLENLNDFMAVLHQKDELITALKQEIKEIHKKIDMGA